MKTAIVFIPIVLLLSFVAGAQTQVVATAPAYDNVEKDKRIKDHAKHALLVNEPSSPDRSFQFELYGKVEPHPRDVVIKPLHLKNYTNNFVR